MLSFAHLKEDYLALREDLSMVLRENCSLRDENAVLRTHASTLSARPTPSQLSPFSNMDSFAMVGDGGKDTLKSETPHAPDLVNHLHDNERITSLFSVPEDDTNSQHNTGFVISDTSLGMSMSEAILEQAQLQQSQLVTALGEVAMLKAQLKDEREKAEDESSDTDEVKSTISTSSRSSRLTGPLDRVARRVQFLKQFVKQREAI